MAALAPVQLKGGGPGGGDDEGGLLNHTEASSTYVALPTLSGGGGGGGGGKQEMSRSIWDRFVALVEALEDGAKGNATQSWGMIIHGMATDSSDSTATKAGPNAKIFQQEFDYAEFMELMGIIMTAIPEGTTPQATLDGWKDIDIYDPEAVAHWAFEVGETLHEAEEDPLFAAIIGGDHEQSTDVVGSTSTTTSGTNDQSDDGDADKTSSGEDVGAGGETVLVAGRGEVPASQVVIIYERAALRNGASIENAPQDARGDLTGQLADGRLWERAYFADGNHKRYAVDGAEVEVNEVPHALWKQPPYSWGSEGPFNKLAPVGRACARPSTKTKSGRTLYGKLPLPLPWPDAI